MLQYKKLVEFAAPQLDQQLFHQFRSISPPAFSIGLQIALLELAPRQIRHILVSRSLPPNSWNRAHSPMKSDRIVMEHVHVFEAAAIRVDRICTNCVASSRACAFPPLSSFRPSPARPNRNSSSNWSTIRGLSAAKAARLIDGVLEAEARLAQAGFNAF